MRDKQTFKESDENQLIGVDVVIDRLLFPLAAWETIEDKNEQTAVAWLSLL